VQRRNFVAAFLVALLVVLAGSWFGFSRIDGVTPVEPASSEASAISDLYLFIGIFAAVIFLSVTIPLALIISRYRERGLPREVEGPQVRGNTRLELGWTLASVVIVLVIVAYTLVQAADINDPNRSIRTAAGPRSLAVVAPELTILVEGRQFYWRYVYPNGAIAIDRLRLPVDRTTNLAVTAPGNDVIHSWWSPALGGKIDAIPRVTNHLQLEPDRVGVFQGRCAELCGIQHSEMNLSVEVMPGDEFDEWLEEQIRDQPELGQVLFEGVCSKCHFAAPEYAPNIAGNPILADREQLEDVVTNGRGRMPPVGRGWSERELDALAEFFAQGEDDGDQS
jgi:cytochrome c oxidase subunit 2